MRRQEPKRRIALVDRSACARLSNRPCGVTDAFGSGLPSALTCPFASSPLPSEMLPGLTVTLFLTVVVLGAVDS